MKFKVRLHIWRVLSLTMFFFILVVMGCGGSSSINRRLEVAENVMENRPDSALAILDSINASDLYGKTQKARYALLKSMALDKNYVDTTTFDILQPAIDYYLEKGTSDEKLRTYYYKGRIYQNRNERDSALHSYMRGLDIAEDCNDSLTIAQTLVVQGIIYQSFYDYDGYTSNYLRAADIFNRKDRKAYEFDCLLNALNGLNILENKERADSVIKLLDGFTSLDNAQNQRLNSHRLTYVLKFGSKQDLKDLIDNYKNNQHLDSNGILNIARTLNSLGDNDMALTQLEYLDDNKANYDTLKYLSIKYPILEARGDYRGALATYKLLADRLDAVNSTKFEQKSLSMEERHRMELEAEREAAEHRKTKWSLSIGIGILVLVVILMLLAINSYRIKKKLAQEKARATEAENDRLKAENELALERTRTTEAENGKLKSEKELALEKARSAELENGKLKSDNELALERARSAELENRNLKTEKEKLELANENLQLERDKKALEAENLAHRVKELEGESDGLKELLQSQNEMPDEVRQAIKTRIEMLNSYLASQISDHKEFEKAYDDWVEGLTADKEKFMDSNRLAFQASHPDFIRYFEDHGLTTSEINYVCLYAIGLRGKDVGNYMKMRSHVNVSSAIRRKLGIDKHETNIGIYVRKKLQEL